MKNVLMWIALIAVLALPVALPIGAVWAIMAAHPGMGIGQAVLAFFAIGIPLFFQMIVGRLARRAFKRPK